MGTQSYRSRWEQDFRDHALSTGLRAGAQGTLRLMATYSNADGSRIKVSQETLAAKQGISVRTVRAHQRSGEGIGWIVCQHRGSGSGDTNVYRLNIATDNENPEISAPLPVKRTRKSETVKAEISDRKGGNVVPTTMHTMHGTMTTPPNGVVINIGETCYLRMVRPDEMNAWDRVEFDPESLTAEERAGWHALIEAESSLP